jgi:hypothetical protein
MKVKIAILSFAFSHTLFAQTPTQNWSSNLNTWGTLTTTANTKLGTSSNHPIRFFTNNTNWMTLSANGRLGLGTSSSLINAPICKFQLETEVNVNGLCVSTNRNIVDAKAFNILSMVNNIWERAYGIMNTTTNETTHAVFGDGRMALGGSVASEMLHVYGNAKITGNIISGGNIFAKDELRIGNAAGDYVPVFMKKNSEGTKKVLSFGGSVLPSNLTNACFNNSAPWSFVFTDGIFATNWQNPNNLVRITHDGAHGILESGTNAPPSPGVQGLLLNYYCGEDVYICTGSNGGKLYAKNTLLGSLKPVLGSAHSDAMLSVDGKIVSKSIYVTQNNWADYVFEENYKLPDLLEVEKYYKANKHLPEIPSEKEIKENGIDIGEMNKLLLKKIEELTILMVEQQKEINALKERIKR